MANFGRIQSVLLPLSSIRLVCCRNATVQSSLHVYTGKLLLRSSGIDAQLMVKQFDRSALSRRFCAQNASSFVFNVGTEEDFAEKVVNSQCPVLVDFYADWCGPCKMLGPRIESKVVSRKGTVMLAKVNVDYASDIAMEYGVNVVPTVIAFRNGEVIDRFEGDQDDIQLDEFIENAVADP